MRNPLLLPCAAVAAGILLDRLVGFEAPELAVALALLGSLAMLAWWKVTARSAGLCGLAAAVAGGALIAVAHRPGPAPELDAGPGETVLLEGCVVDPPVFSEGREQFVTELARGARARVSVFLRDGQTPPPLEYGQTVEVGARVRKPRNFGNPGSFDYAGYLAFRQIYWTASARGPEAVRDLGRPCGSRVLAAVYRLRSKALERLDELYGADTYSATMLRAILIGDSGKLERAWVEHFRRTGTYHALVISGLHVTVLASVLLFLLRVCAVQEALALVATGAAGWLYAVVAGGSAPVVRAAGGLTLYLIARFFFRRPRVLNLLAATALVILAIEPGQLFEASFQLTFLSVAAIGAIAVPLLDATTAPLAAGLRGLDDADRDPHLEPRVAQFRIEMRLLAETAHLWTRIPRRWMSMLLALSLRGMVFLSELFVVSATVQLGLALPMVVYFHRLSATGLSANLIVVPLMSLAVPAGFLAVFTGWRLPAEVTALLVEVSRRVTDWHAGWEPAWRIPDPPLWLALGWVAALLAVAVSIGSSGRTALAAMGATVALTGVIVWHPFPASTRAGELEVTAMDVGQGDSLLVISPDGRRLLVDGGGIPTWRGRSRPRLDFGEDVVSPYLWSRSIRRLDVVALTHPHEDHMGGLAALIENFRPSELWAGDFRDNPAFSALTERSSALGVRTVVLREGERRLLGRASIDVFVSPKGTRNNDSLVLRAAFGHRTILLTGDMEGRHELELLSGPHDLRSDVLKVAHHGSRTSTTGALLDRTHPSLALISAGADNSYGHPHPDVLARLAERGIAVLRTDRHGLVTLRTDGRRIDVDTRYWSGEPRRAVSPF